MVVAYHLGGLFGHEFRLFVVGGKDEFGESGGSGAMRTGTYYARNVRIDTTVHWSSHFAANYGCR